jgi:hypothetical protein
MYIQTVVHGTALSIPAVHYIDIKGGGGGGEFLIFRQKETTALSSIEDGPNQSGNRRSGNHGDKHKITKIKKIQGRLPTKREKAI